MADAIAVLVVLLLLGLFVYWIVRFAGRSRRVAINERLVWPEDVSRALPRIIEAVAPDLTGAGYRIDAQSDRAIIFSLQYRPGWTVVVAILLFPIGLLALLVRNGVSLSVTLTPRSEETDVSVSGSGTPLAEEVFEDLAASAARLAGRPTMTA